MMQSAAAKRRRFIELGGEFEGEEWIVYKFVTKGYQSPTAPSRGWGSLSYPVGAAINDKKKPNTNPSRSCGAGVNLHASLPKAVRPIGGAGKVLVEGRILATDVVCVPNDARCWTDYESFTGGPKFRVSRVRIVASYKRDAEGKLTPIKLAPGYEVAP